MTYQLLHGNNLEVLPTLPDNSVDSIVTDPPYELGFMGKKWDSSGIAYSVELWAECLRVLKPGGHLLAFSGPRTYHRMTVAIEDAGFEIRDMISWISNKTFPKSLNISKAIDKAAGAEREVIGSRPLTGTGKTLKSGFHQPDGTGAGETIKESIYQFTKAATTEAEQWEGWGTGLKPTVEPIVMARKPIDGTVAANVLKWGTGGININGSRIAHEDQDVLDAAVKRMSGNSVKGQLNFAGNETIKPNSAQGRWPANIIIDEVTAELIDKQSGNLKGGVWNNTAGARHFNNDGKLTQHETTKKDESIGGASRFFYVAKASKRDRNEGLEELPDHEWRNDGAAIPQRADRPFLPSKNHHPTVKPTSLMEYLVTLVTPPNGTVLDPFTGSGSTGKAAILKGFDFIGIEMTDEYLPIIEGRLKYAERIVAERKEEETNRQEETLF